ncbi:adhesion G-protein coupled receptor F3 [Clinocottus analis]|uniref:adhesion G-protein coupled receptor F3 n=1 Tax=Clinocottus analis TaxID=304258 RepID=UPI0035BF7AE8
MEKNSTQMYYFKMTIEESAIANITARWTPFVSNTDVKVDDVKMTTICQSVPGGAECSCQPDFRWSDRVCQESEGKCCGDEKCTFTNNAGVCVSNDTVVVNGSITLSGENYYDCLKEEVLEQFKQCNNKLLREMKTVYSTLPGFDVITISNYRIGSVIADFEIYFAQNVKRQELREKTERLSSHLLASVDLETKGVVRLIMPPNSPVCYYDKPELRCVSQEDLNTPPVWQLRRDGTVFEIFNGTEAEVTTAPLETKLTLRNISELWAGKYTCMFKQKLSSINITHKASAAIDISLLPKIDITNAPAFPRCRNSSDVLSVRVRCELESNKEMYIGTWTGFNLFTGPFQLPDDHSSDVIVSCDETLNPSVTCTFKNRCNEERNATVVVNVIYENNQFCAAEGDWEDTKAGFTAVLKCIDAAGPRRRKCKQTPTQAIWEPEVSTCVKQIVNSVLQQANIIDIGLGSLHENAANVFSLLENVTNNTATINTFADMSASVEVLTKLSQKIKSINTESTVNDFLESSSNLLEKSLNESWTTGLDEGNISLAESYLDSLEKLIQLTNVTRVPKKKNIELAASNCPNRSKCQSTVFNNNVVLVSSDPGSVKTAGFKELENYLPNKDERYEPNSIVVSVTTERKQLDSVEVKINFSLIRPRARDVDMKCVAWDNGTKSWSPEGCEWMGASDEGLCVCRHLSSFAVLMSRYPLNINGLTEVTLVGLSVSVIALILTLAIELIVWSDVVKTDTLYIRHSGNVNICLCLLVADFCFLVSLKLTEENKDTWCKTFVVLKHFCYLSMFFWMLCQSSMLLHQAIFPFHRMSRKTYMRSSIVLGYVCPLLIAVITLLSYSNGAEGEYYSKDTCWLCYSGLMKGSIHTFVIPVGIIVLFNVLSMVIVIIKILDHPVNSDNRNGKEKKAAVTVMRAVILLTPIFGVTWFFGFAVMLLDLTSGPIVVVVHYAFNLLNTFQGLFILLTTCLADKMTHEALLKLIKKNAPASTTESTTQLHSTSK